MANELTFSGALTTSLEEVSAALPVGFNTTRFVQNAVALLNENKILSDFARKNGTSQIKAGLLRGAYLGLDFMNKEAYLVPYGSQLNFMIDYRGARKLVKRYSIRPVKDIYAKVVREGDEFLEQIENGVTNVTFNPKPFNDGDIIGAFAVCLFEDGGILVETMSRKELDVTRSKSKASNSMAWKDFPSEMYKKTVIHRLCKGIELEFSNPEQNIYFHEDMSIETDINESVKNDIELNANTEVFEIDDGDFGE